MNSILSLIIFLFTPLNPIVEAFRDGLAAIAGVLLDFAEGIAKFIDTFAIRNPYPCPGSPDIQPVCSSGSGGGTAFPELSPFNINTFEPTFTSGFWGMLMEMHIFIVIASIMIIVVGVAVSALTEAADVTKVTSEDKSVNSISGVIVSLVKVFFWWPLAVLGLWAAENFAILISSILTLGIDSSFIADAVRNSGTSGGPSLPTSGSINTTTQVGGGIAQAMEASGVAIASEGIGGLSLLIIMLIITLIPYIIFSVVLILLWSIRLTLVIVLLPFVPLKFALNHLRFPGGKALSNVGDSLTSIYFFVAVVAPITVGFASGIMGVMAMALATVIYNVTGLSAIALPVYVIYLMYAVLIYGFAPVLLMRYTDYDPGRGVDGNISSVTDKMKGVSVKDIAKGKANKGAASSLRDGDFGGAAAASSKAIQDRIGISDDDSMVTAPAKGAASKTAGKIDEKTGASTKYKNKKEQTAQDVRGSAKESVETGKAFVSAIGNDGNLFDREHMERRQEYAREAADREREEVEEKAKEREFRDEFNKDYKNTEWRALDDEMEEDDVMSILENENSKRMLDVNDFDYEEASSYEDIERQALESMANSVEDSTNSVNHNDVGDVLDNKKEFVEAVKNSEIYNDEKIRNEIESIDADSLVSEGAEDQFIEKLERAGILGDTMKEMDDEVEFEDSFRRDARELTKVTKHADEHDLDEDELNPEFNEMVPFDNIDNEEAMMRGLGETREYYEDKGSEMFETIGKMKGGIYGSVLGNVSEEFQDKAESFIAGEIDEDEYDGDTREELFAEYFSKDGDIEEVIDEVIGQMDAEGIEQNMLDEIKTEVKEEWDNSTGRTYENFNEVINEAQSNIDDRDVTMDDMESEAVGIPEVMEKYDLFDQYDLDVDSAEEFRGKYNKSNVEKFRDMFGIPDDMEDEDVVKVIEGGYYDKENLSKSLINGGISKEQLEEVGSMMEEKE